MLFKLKNNSSCGTRYLVKRLLGPYYYREIQSIADPAKVNRRFVWHHFLNLVFAVQFVRCFTIFFATLYSNDSYFQYDLLSRMRRNVMNFDPYMLLCFCSLFLFMAGHNTIYYYASRRFIWNLIFDLVGLNCGDIYRSNRHLLSDFQKDFSNSSFSKKLSMLCQIAKQYLCLWKRNTVCRIGRCRVKFQSKLRYFPFSSDQTRIRTCAVVLFWESLLTLVLVLLILLSVMVMPYYIRKLLDMSASPFRLVITLADVLSSFYISWICFKIGCFALYTQLIVLFAINATFRELYLIVEKRLLCWRTLNRCLGEWAMMQTMVNFRQEHARLTRYILVTDDRYWSAGLCNFYLHNIPINVYLITYLVYRYLDQMAAIMLYYILAIQLFGVTLSMLPAGKASKLVHHPVKYMCALQAKLTSQRYLSLKLKYMAFAEQVTTSNLIAYHVGPFFSITNRTIFELLYVYCGFFIYTIRLISN